MDSSRRPVAAFMLAIGLVGFSAAASGCSVASPKTIMTPYQAADGTNADLPLGPDTSVQLRNFLLVSAAKGQPGVLVGAVSTSSPEPVQLQVSVVNPAGSAILGQAVLTARPGALTTVGPNGDATVQVPDVPLPPGSVLTIRVQAAAGEHEFALPVLTPVAQYSSITPTASPSATERSSTSPTKSPTSSSSPSSSSGSGSTRTTSPSAASPSAS
ncbi:MAG TPA: hypothetical protein VI248_20275 [Kineosporiaceae bacterium]